METTNTNRDVLIAVDVQNDFISGSLAVREGEQVVRPLNQLAESVRTSGGDVIFTRDWHPAVTPHFETWPVHCVAETEGAEFSSELDIKASDTIISKGMEQTDGYSGVEGVSDDGKTLEQIIQPRDSNEKVRVLIGGLATDYCVKATAIDVAKIFEHDKRVTTYLIRDAIRAVNMQPNDEAEALAAIAEAGVIALTSDEVRRRFYAQEGARYE